MQPFFATLLVAAAFLIGSTPTAYLLGRMKGVDIRRHGSGNIGATNALRVLGKPWGVACLLVDALKGWLPTMLGAWTAQLFILRWPIDSWMWIGGLAAIAGHMFTPFLGFKGGKGVATSIGVMLAIAPLPLLITAVAAVLVIWLTGFVSLASMVSAALLPPLIVILDVVRYLQLRANLPPDAIPPQLKIEWTSIAITAALAATIAWRHRSNIQRLRSGTEPRIFDQLAGHAKPSGTSSL